MAEEALGARAVVVGRHEEQAVGAGAFRLARALHGRPRAVRAGARDHREAAGRALDRRL